MADAATQRPVVIKVGGSLAEAGRLKSALAIICQAQRPVVIVPGGGAFAGKVRDLQKAVRFDDAAAHRLAMLGMHQMAEHFVTLEPRLSVVESLGGIAHALASGRVPVWVPLPMLDHDTTIPSDWSITSDGIAARLTELLGGAPLVLLKSIDVAADATAAELAQDSVVDAFFPVIAGRAALDWRIFGPSSDAALRAFLENAKV